MKKSTKFDGRNNREKEEEKKGLSANSGRGHRSSEPISMTCRFFSLKLFRLSEKKKIHTVGDCHLTTVGKVYSCSGKTRKHPGYGTWCGRTEKQKKIKDTPRKERRGCFLILVAGLAEHEIACLEGRREK